MMSFGKEVGDYNLYDGGVNIVKALKSAFTTPAGNLMLPSTWWLDVQLMMVQSEQADHLCVRVYMATNQQTHPEMVQQARHADVEAARCCRYA